LANHRQNERNELLVDAVRHGNLDGFGTSLQNRADNNEPIGAPVWFKPGEIVQKIEFPYEYSHSLLLRGPWISYQYINPDICELHYKKMHRETVEIIHSNVPNYLGIEYNESMKNTFRNSNEPIYRELIVENSFEKYICEECNKMRDEYMRKRIQ
jgi:hypothetical protein